MIEPEHQAVCPLCHNGIEVQTPQRGRAPEPGWACVCMECGGVSVVDQALQRNDGPDSDVFLRPATVDEFAEAMEVTALRMLRAAALEKPRALGAAV